MNLIQNQRKQALYKTIFTPLNHPFFWSIRRCVGLSAIISSKGWKLHVNAPIGALVDDWADGHSLGMKSRRQISIKVIFFIFKFIIGIFVV